MAAWEAANNSGASWGLEALRRTFETPHSLIWVAEGEGELRGYLIGLELPDGFELLNLLVPPAARRQGVGSFLLAELLVLAGAAGRRRRAPDLNAAGDGLGERGFGVFSHASYRFTAVV